MKNCNNASYTRLFIKVNLDEFTDCNSLEFRTSIQISYSASLRNYNMLWLLLLTFRIHKHTTQYLQNNNNKDWLRKFCAEINRSTVKTANHTIWTWVWLENLSPLTSLILEMEVEERSRYWGEEEMVGCGYQTRCLPEQVVVVRIFCVLNVFMTPCGVKL